jgi:Lhr-like helicase
VAARRVHEELQRVERAGDGRGRDRASLLGSLLAHDDIALLECGAKAGEVVLRQLVLVRQSLDVLLLDEAALGGLLEQALDRREVMQVNRVVQCYSFRS